MNFFFKRNNLNIVKKINSKTKLKRYIEFFIGCLISAIAFNLFLAPSNIVAGGVSGIAIVFNYLFKTNNSIIILIGNILLVILCYFTLGKEKAKNTILGSIAFPILVLITENINNIININNTELLLSSIFGGILLGLGGGMIYKAGFSTGGTDILNHIISKYKKISVGTSILLTDGLIVLISSFIFGPIRLMYAIIILYLTSIISDKVILGISDSKAFYIITNKSNQVKDYIIKNMHHGVTIFNVKGAFLEKRRKVLLVIIPTREYFRVTEGIKLIDKDVFFVVTDAYQVEGGK